MNRIIITTTSDEHIKSLAEMLNSLDFIESVDVYEEDEEELTGEEMQMAKERIEEYRRNPQPAKTWNEVYRELKTKYGK